MWWLLLVPAGLILWCQFRLAGLLGLQEFDAVAIWAFKAKILHCCAGKEIWTWFKNPGLAYAHLDYPLLVPLLHALTYGALGHVNEFVTKFWNQWMLLLLAWAVLGAGRFPEKRPWLAACGGGGHCAAADDPGMVAHGRGNHAHAVLHGVEFRCNWPLGWWSSRRGGCGWACCC